MRRAGCPIGGGPWPLPRCPAAAVPELSTPPTHLASPSTRDWRSERARWSRRCCPWFLRYRGPGSPCARPAMAATALPRSGMAGLQAALSRIPRARRRQGGTRVGARSGAATPGRTVRCSSPAGAMSGLERRTRLALRLRPSGARPRDGSTPSVSPASQNRAGGRCAVRRRRCPRPRPDPGAGRRRLRACVPPTPACSSRPLSRPLGPLGRVWARPIPTHSGHLSCPS